MPHRPVEATLSVVGPQVVELTIELPDTVYVEGSTIDATVLAMAGRDVVVTRGDVELVRNVSYQYRSGGMGGSNTATARHSQVVARSVFHTGGPLPGGQPLVQPVRLLVPSDGPGSVRAELLKVTWAVRARLRTKGCRDAEATKHILVLSEARECAAVAQSAPLVEDRGCAVLGFESLSSRRLVGGVPLFGVLTVTPLRPVTARALRVDLLLAEHVAHGPLVTDDPARSPANEDKDADTIVASVALAGQLGSPVAGQITWGCPRSLRDWLSRTRYEGTVLLASGRICFEAKQQLRFPFHLPVPPRLQGPSVRTPDYSLRWMLRGVLDRRLHADPCITVEMHAVTTAL
ncbi:MAG: arrestin C-terminal domain-containing protein [Frankiaceae bacterium]